MKRIAKYGVLYNFSVMLGVGIIVVLLAKYGVSLFIRDTEAVEFGTRYLQIIALCYPFLGINFILNGIIRASGAIYQVLVLNMGTCFLTSSLIAYLYYRFGKWRERELFTHHENG